MGFAFAGDDLTALLFLTGAAFLATTVRGFAGFGTGMIYLPIAAQVLSPFEALTTLVIFEVIGPIPIVWKARRACETRDLARLIAGVLVALPLGLWALTMLSTDVFRTLVSGVALVLLVFLITGIRYRGPLTQPLVYLTGGLAGLSLGVTGLPGPPVILLYMASTKPVAVIRANTMLFLYFSEFVFLPMLALFGRLEPSAIALGLMLVLPTMLGGIAGEALFRPGYERVYRWVAYAIIACAALSGLPIWS